MKAKSLLFGFMVGAAAAGISTLLTAPASGRDTLRCMQQRKENLQNQISELNHKLIQLKDTAITASKEGRKGITAFSSDVTHSIKNWKQEILPHQQELQKELQAIESALQELEKNLNGQKA
ncbi:YtxH domain-containing protein [Cytobacillus sp. FJAT-53684]|uniref:YtxH domain-containing protein n=1 Tax=Cytobacillus mangrovibacter TaxID=3299024 RepID=A0ABW6JWL0_9BACI